MSSLTIVLAAILTQLVGCASDVSLPVTSAPPSPPAVGSISPSDRQSTPDAASDHPGLADHPLHNVALEDVRTGAEFTLGDLAAEKPVLLEMMAIWCTNCRAQMHRVVEAHGIADFHSVGIDIDPSEQPADLAAYVEDQGFDWPFAMATADLVGLLRAEFGDLVINPPSTPMAILYPDGSIRQLEFRGYDVDELVAALARS
jgi:thiol-disulfide isomerase/thioredoxin